MMASPAEPMVMKIFTNSMNSLSSFSQDTDSIPQYDGNNSLNASNVENFQVSYPQASNNQPPSRLAPYVLNKTKQLIAMMLLNLTLKLK